MARRAVLRQMAGERPSQHPVDRLIREIVDTRREATTEEIDQVIERMAAAPFDQCTVPVPMALRAVSYLGTLLSAREDSLTYHLISPRGWSMSASGCLARRLYATSQIYGAQFGRPEVASVCSGAAVAPAQ